MNKRDLKKLRIDESYVMSPKRFLIRLGIKGVPKIGKITLKHLHFILEHKLCQADIFDVKADAIYRGDIFLIGTAGEFYPYYNPMRHYQKTSKAGISQKDDTQKEMSLSELYDKYLETGKVEYLNELYDRVYKTKIEESEPTKTKIYLKYQRQHF